MSSSKFKSIVLVILDGWGVAPPGIGNAIANAHLSYYNSLVKKFPNTTLLASGEAVGLLNNDPGNTETGHVNIASGRIIKSPISIINEALRTGSFFKNRIFRKVTNHLKKYGGNLHLMGLFGSGHVHASNDHLMGLLLLAKRNSIKNVYLHLFTDGRDSPRTAALSQVDNLRKQLEHDSTGAIASISGRFYAMDRDRRWQRTRKTYDALIQGLGNKATSPQSAIEEFYKKGVTDEFIPPTVFTENSGKPLGLIAKNDAVVFYNHRGERARQLTEMFVNQNLQKLNIFFVTMTEFDKYLKVSAVAFPPERIKMTLGEVLSINELRQLRMAETEKERFVTYYFNGFQEKSFPLEDRIIIPSPKVSTYDLAPEMSALKLTEALLAQLKTGLYSFILINFANPDMVGHTGLFKPTIKACEIIDACLAKITDCVLKMNGLVIITADHGNAEEKIDLKTGLTLTEHTDNPVPLIFVDRNFSWRKLLKGGILADLAPTILKLMGIQVPKEMTGKNLLNGQ